VYGANAVVKFLGKPRNGTSEGMCVRQHDERFEADRLAVEERAAERLAAASLARIDPIIFAGKIRTSDVAVRRHRHGENPAMVPEED